MSQVARQPCKFLRVQDSHSRTRRVLSSALPVFGCTWYIPVLGSTWYILLGSGTWYLPVHSRIRYLLAVSTSCTCHSVHTCMFVPVLITSVLVVRGCTTFGVPVLVLSFNSLYGSFYGYYLRNSVYILLVLLVSAALRCVIL